VFAMADTNRTNTDRIYLRIEPDLKEEMIEYCERNGVTMSQLVKRFFKKLLERESKNFEARQF
jgi:antitoxin component of RelBE/YafQ-DinJ toxin-antitoxin module